ncbi:phosphopantetheine-binding protein [Schlesneria paludicola]|uniref:phosphopantetheine-binding protein n=1 Tax=Schlesneria paludicola TaxID=360056 RepID=UPI00029A5389|nr:phosphopantetheine-binding protein [Schlesneria paludicola]
MELSELIAEFEQLCNAAPGSLNQDSIIEVIPGWSSLAFLGVIAVADDMFSVTLKPRQLMQCSTIADLYSLLQSLRGDSSASSNSR